MNSKSTKKKLTGSIWALVVCFILLLGTTFAWFTDTASTNVNKIEAGTLDVALQKATSVDNDGNIEWAELEKDEVLNFVDKEGEPLDNILWEPGCTYKLPTLRVANNGSLALKYKVELESIVSATGDEKLAEVIDVYLGETKVGNLKEFIESKDNDGFAHGELTANTETGPLEISLHMQESAGNEYQAMTIDGIKVTVYATQLNSESDSYGPDYDKNAEYAAKATSLEALNNALKTGQENIVFDDNVTIDVNQNDHYSAIRVDKSQGAADVVTLDGAGTVTSSRFIIWARAGAKVIVNGGNYVSTGSDHLVYANLGGIVEINGGTFSGATADHFFNISNGDRGSIIIKGGLYSRDPSTQIAGNDVWNGTTGVKIEDGYKVVEKNIGGTIWYQVVPE